MLERIGEFQRIPAEEVTRENINKKYTLVIERLGSAGNINTIRISNRDEAEAQIAHEIRIDGKNGYVGRALAALVKALEIMKSTEERVESKMKQEMERVQKEMGVPVILTPGFLSKDVVPEERLPEYDLKVRRSRYDVQDIFFIVKGIEKEDTATEPPFKIGVEGNGDFVSVSRENLQPLIEELQKICQLSS